MGEKRGEVIHIIFLFFKKIFPLNVHMYYFVIKSRGEESILYKVRVKSILDHSLIPWGSGYGLVPCCIISLYISQQSSSLIYVLLTHFRSCPLMSMGNLVHACWIFMYSSPFSIFSQNWGFPIRLWTEITHVKSRWRHSPARVPSPSLLCSNPGSRVWRNRNQGVARTRMLESLVEISTCQLVSNLVWKRNKPSLYGAPEIWGFHSVA